MMTLSSSLSSLAVVLLAGSVSVKAHIVPWVEGMYCINVRFFCRSILGRSPPGLS